MSEDLEQENVLVCMNEPQEGRRYWRIGSMWGDQSVLDIFCREGIVFAGNENGSATRIQTEVREGDLILVTKGNTVMAIAEVRSPGADMTKFRRRRVVAEEDEYFEDWVCGVRVKIYRLSDEMVASGKYQLSRGRRFQATWKEEDQMMAESLWATCRELEEARRGNLFSWANKELAQDAFFCWLFERAQANPNSAEGRAAKQIIEMLAQGAMNDGAAFTAGPLTIYKQWWNIDILLAFGENESPERRFLVIEDKVGAGLYNDLDEYCARVTEAFKVPPEQVRCAVIKTEDDGMLASTIRALQAENAQGKAKHVIPNVMLRKDLLAVFDAHKKPREAEDESDTYNDFVEHLQEREEAFSQYKRLAFAEWSEGPQAWEGWRGLFTALSTEPGSPFDRWCYVNNPSQPFNALCLDHDLVRLIFGERYELYYHINSETGELQLRVCEVEQESRTAVRTTIFQTVEALKERNDPELAPLKLFQRPARFGSGWYIGIENLPARTDANQKEGDVGTCGWLELDTSGKVDVPKTVERLRVYADLLKKVADALPPTFA